MDLSTVANVCQIASVVVLPVGIWAWRKFTSELKPNHGSSMRDAIDRIERRQKKDRKENRSEIAELRALISDHLAEFE
jgi:hypothetical protein